jgi:hypothetical protein
MSTTVGEYQAAQALSGTKCTVCCLVAALFIIVSASVQVQQAPGQSIDLKFRFKPAAGWDTASTASDAESALVMKTPTLECPIWFSEYEKFHAAARGKPGTKYLIHQVPDRSVSPGSGGLGDRLRGMLYALRLAAAYKRVLLFSWGQPVRLEQLLVPAGDIDWTLDGIPEFSNNSMTDVELNAVVESKSQEPSDPQEKSMSAKVANATEQVVIVRTNLLMDAECSGCPHLPALEASTGCVWARLFKPTKGIKAAAQQELMRLYNSSSPRFVAVHLRLGGFTGEGEHERGQGPLKNFAGAVRCATQLAREHNISSSTPILMVTDNQHLRSFLREGHLLGVVSPDGDAVHLDLAPALDHNLTSHSISVVDMLLLSRGVCLVTSPGFAHSGLSGFSHQSWLLGGAKPCHIDFKSCI